MDRIRKPQKWRIKQMSQQSQYQDLQDLKINRIKKKNWREITYADADEL
ncbi:MAG: hypothetical protein RLZZ381_98 [Cyanobacteriota bacterium]